MISEMYLQYFTAQKDFPFYIQYGHHDENIVSPQPCGLLGACLCAGAVTPPTLSMMRSIRSKKGMYLSSTKIHPTPIRIRVISGSVILCFNRTNFLKNFGLSNRCPAIIHSSSLNLPLTQQNGFQSRISSGARMFSIPSIR